MHPSTRSDHILPVQPRGSKGPYFLRDLLTGIINSRGWSQRLRQEIALSTWSSVAGPELAQHTLPLAVRDGVLHIAVENGIWATQLMYFRTDLLRRLRDANAPELLDLAFHVHPNATYCTPHDSGSLHPNPESSKHQAHAPSIVLPAHEAPSRAGLTPLRRTLMPTHNPFLQESPDTIGGAIL